MIQLRSSVPHDCPPHPLLTVTGHVQSSTKKGDTSGRAFIYAQTGTSNHNDIHSFIPSSLSSRLRINMLPALTSAVSARLPTAPSLSPRCDSDDMSRQVLKLQVDAASTLCTTAFTPPSATATPPNSVRSASSASSRSNSRSNSFFTPTSDAVAVSVYARATTRLMHERSLMSSFAVFVCVVLSRFSCCASTAHCDCC